jgi:MFS family permease
LVVRRFVPEESKANRDDGKGVPPPQPKIDGTAAGEPLRQARPRVAPFVGLGFLIASTAEMLNGLFPILATEYAGLSKAQAGVVYAVSTLTIIFSGPFFGWLSDNVSRKLVLAVRGVANTFSSVLYVVAPTFAGLAVAKTADDMGKAAFRPAWGALMAEISGYDKRNRARTMSWMSMGEDAGGALSPILAGFLWSTWGITALMGTRVLLAIVTEIYAFLVTHPRHKRAPGNTLEAHGDRCAATAVIPNSGD